MRAWICVFAVTLSLGGTAAAQEGAEDGEMGGAYGAALTDDEDAQWSLGGFRLYLQRIESSDPELYADLDPRLDDLETRETAADVIFWLGTGLGAAALLSAIPVHETLGLDPAIGFMIAGGSTFVLALIIQAIVRPGRGDLVQLIDRYDERVGHRGPVE